MLVDEPAHEFDAFGILNDINTDPSRPHKFFRSEEGLIFANHHAGNFVEHNGATAHGAG